MISTFRNLRDLYRVIRYRNGSFYYETHTSAPKYTRYLTYEQKLKVVFSNPAVLKVFKLNCDLFSLGMLGATSESGKARENDKLLKLLKSPNPFQNRRQFMWDAMFYYMMGNSYLYRTRKIVSDSTYLYWLNPKGLYMNDDLIKKLGQMYISPIQVRQLAKEIVKYQEPNGKTRELMFGDIMPFHDLSNGISGNWFESNGVLDALYKVVSNSEASLDSKNINIRFSGKYMVAGKSDINNVHGVPMSPEEKEQIEANVQSPKSVTAVKALADIKRYVENIDKLKLDESYRNDFMIIGGMYGIPKDVLDVAFKGSTYENQEKATGRHVEYSFKPKAADLMGGIEKMFGYDKKSTRLTYTFDHLLFMRIFEREIETGKTVQLNNLVAAKENGLITGQQFISMGKQIFNFDE